MGTVILSNKILAKIRNFFSPDDQARLEEEIQSIIDAGEEKGLIDQQSGEMIQSILEFRDTVVREVMIPRTEMIAIRNDANIEEILELTIRYGHTRMPVYADNVDNILGILNVKDLLKFWSKPITETEILTILRKPYYIPETKNTHHLLHELKEKKYHMAIVIDEYGGTSGLVTLEDLIEEIVGEIPDEHDAKKGSIVELSDGYTLIDGRVEIEVIEDYLGIKFQEGKFETLGGFILNLLRRIPVTGEVIHVDNLEMIIETADERSVKKVKLKKFDGAQEQGGGSVIKIENSKLGDE
ncbi:MAG TPA: hemolysin family protein [Syntrophales bacterium]|nr:hemolysin family protein [Syntrophales bacterium]